MKNAAIQPLSIVVLPLLYLAAAFWMRAEAGPDWLWFNVDPAYFYLFDPLNILELAAPGQINHPGTTLQWLGALSLKLSAPLTPVDALIQAALNDPEAYLFRINAVFITLNALAMLALGWAAVRVWQDSLAGAVLQMAPFISMLIFKNSIFPRPEALLVFTTLMLMTAGVMTLVPGMLDRRPGRFAAAFGIIAGFGIATKLTFAPIIVLPLFVLTRRRTQALYIVCAAAALLLFVSPMLPRAGQFVQWISQIGQGTGDYGTGAAGFIDWAVYPKSVLHLFKRPAFHIVFILSLLTLAAAAWRKRQNRAIVLPAAELRLLAGVSAAQLCQVLLVAKQPSAHYLIPAFVLIPLGLVLVWRLQRPIWGGGDTAGRRLRLGLGVLLAALTLAQGHAAWKTGQEFADARKIALGVDNARFAQCARIYFASPSSPSYALMNGDFITGGRFAERLAAIGPDNDYWLEHSWHDSPLTFRGWHGPADLQATLQRYPCAMLRGSRWHEISAGTYKMAPQLRAALDCSIRDETIFVLGADCDGRLAGPGKPPR